MMKRKIDLSVKDSEEVTGERIMDYANFLNEKENQVIALEKKVQNLEERLRRAHAR